MDHPRNLTATTLASYTNYRYFQEILSSGLLPAQPAWPRESCTVAGWVKGAVDILVRVGVREVV